MVDNSSYMSGRMPLEGLFDIFDKKSRQDSPVAPLKLFRPPKKLTIIPKDQDNFEDKIFNLFKSKTGSPVSQALLKSYDQNFKLLESRKNSAFDIGSERRHPSNEKLKNHCMIDDLDI
jgi:hypothetical protein